jgi:hypothetical protein
MSAGLTVRLNGRHGDVALMPVTVSAIPAMEACTTLRGREMAPGGPLSVSISRSWTEFSVVLIGVFVSMAVREQAMSDSHNHTPEEEHRIREAALDETVAGSFPASDPASSLPNPDEHDAEGNGVEPADDSPLRVPGHRNES